MDEPDESYNTLLGTLGYMGLKKSAADSLKPTISVKDTGPIIVRNNSSIDELIIPKNTVYQKIDPKDFLEDTKGDKKSNLITNVESSEKYVDKSTKTDKEISKDELLDTTKSYLNKQTKSDIIDFVKEFMDISLNILKDK